MSTATNEPTVMDRLVADNPEMARRMFSAAMEPTNKLSRKANPKVKATALVPQTVEIKPGDKVLVTLQGPYAGQTGDIVGFHTTEQQWVVLLDDGVHAFFEAGQLLLQQSASARGSVVSLYMFISDSDDEYDSEVEESQDFLLLNSSQRTSRVSSEPAAPATGLSESKPASPESAVSPPRSKNHTQRAREHYKITKPEMPTEQKSSESAALVLVSKEPKKLPKKLKDPKTATRTRVRKKVTRKLRKRRKVRKRSSKDTAKSSVVANAKRNWMKIRRKCLIQIK